MKFKQYIKIYTCWSKTTIMHNLHMNIFGCKWPMKKSWETLKKYVTSSNNLQKNNFYDLTRNFGQLQKHVQHSRFSLLHRYVLSPNMLISWHTYDHHICLFHDTYKCNFQTWTSNNTSKYIPLDLKYYNNAHFTYQLSLGVNNPWRNNNRHT